MLKKPKPVLALLLMSGSRLLRWERQTGKLTTAKAVVESDRKHEI